MRYGNLIGEMAKEKITIEALSNLLSLHRNTISNKLNGGSFSIEEAETIRDTFFPKLSLKYLFKKTKSGPACDVD